MREARIMLPNQDNEGREVATAHRYLKVHACQTFGGYTATASNGGWYDPLTATLYEEPATAYDIAAEESPENTQRLTELATEAGQLAGQLAVYLRLPNGTVEIVVLRPAVAPAPSLTPVLAPAA